jgi:hypothetical protein
MGEIADTDRRYAEIIRRVLDEYAALAATPQPVGAVRVEKIVDDAQGHYEILLSGWVGGRRVHGPMLHLDVRDGKVWVEHDGTSPGVVDDLLAAGIPASDIVLAFHPPEVRPLTGFALG